MQTSPPPASTTTTTNRPTPTTEPEAGLFADAKVEARARAQSTGSGSANSQALRIAASFARVQRESSSSLAKFNSGTGNNDDARMLATTPTTADDSATSRREPAELLGRNSNSPEPGAEICVAGANSVKELDALSYYEQNAVELLNKSSFTCTLIGARQTGKRTIVKCFVKILNEFKIAADEYKKEKMLSKLMDCSERLQELSGQQQDNEPTFAPRSRINSWFSGISMNKLVGGASAGPNKRRLHSTAGIMMQTPRQDEYQQQQRRHTAIDSTFGAQRGHERESGEQVAPTSRYGNFLSPDGQQAQRECVKSDSNINYKTESELENNANNESIAMTQLRVPSLESQRKGSDDGAPFPARPRPSSGSVYFPEDLDECTRRYSQQRSIAGGRGRRKRRPTVSLKELNRRRLQIRFKTRRQTSESLLLQFDKSKESAQTLEERQQMLLQNLPDSFFVVYAINDRDSFEYAKVIVGQLRSIRTDGTPLPIVLVANKIDLERAKVVKSEEGRALARKNACKFIEISCTVGFNLDNLLVGLRTQLILKHHVALNSVIRSSGKQPAAKKTTTMGTTANKSEATDKSKGNDNILVRFYKKYVMDNYEQNYDCDNFSKL